MFRRHPRSRRGRRGRNRPGVLDDARQGQRANDTSLSKLADMHVRLMPLHRSPSKTAGSDLHVADTHPAACKVVSMTAQVPDCVWRKSWGRKPLTHITHAAHWLQRSPHDSSALCDKHRVCFCSSRCTLLTLKPPSLQALYGGNASDTVLVVGGVHVSNLTVILDYGFTAVLLFMAARSFAKVADDTSNQLRLVFQARAGPRLQGFAAQLPRTPLARDAKVSEANMPVQCRPLYRISWLCTLAL